MATWKQLMLSDGRVVLDADGKRSLVDDDDTCCPVSGECAQLPCLQPTCLNVDICGIKFCRCFTWDSFSGEVDRWRFGAGAQPFFGRHLVRWDGAGCEYEYFDTANERLTFDGWFGCNCEADPPTTDDWSLYLAIEVALASGNIRVRVRACIVVDFAITFSFVMFEGEAAIPADWIDACGKPTAPVTVNNSYTACDDCGDEGASPVLGNTYDYDHDAIVAGIGGTVVVGKLDGDPVQSPCTDDGECADEGEEDPCTGVTCEDCSAAPSSYSADISGVSLCDGCDCQDGDMTWPMTLNHQTGCIWDATINPCTGNDVLNIVLTNDGTDWVLSVICFIFGFPTLMWEGKRSCGDGDPVGTYTRSAGCSANPATGTIS